LILPARVLGADGQVAPSNRITLGAIGVGEQGFNDLRNFLGRPEVRVTALCDVNARNLERAQKAVGETYGKPDVKLYRDFRELNADPSIDAVLMALPVHWHSIPSIDAVLRGKHIFHEKPVALSFVEAARLRTAVHRQGVVFQFGTQQRSDRKFRWASELALNGRLGKLKEIHVSVPGGHPGPKYDEQPVPDFLDWKRWVGPAPATPFHAERLKRDNHENMTAFSLGMISCWGIHHLDIAQWGNGTDATGPTTVEGSGQFPKEGSLDAILGWKVRFEFEKAAPVTFVQDGTPGFSHGIRFVGDQTWVHVTRGELTAEHEKMLDDPQSKCGAMPIVLPASDDHTRNFVDAIRNRKRAICDIDASVRTDTLCQLALISVKQGRKLKWDPTSEQFPGDEASNALLQPRPPQDGWKLPEV
jgi:predicted dehydrogenase